MCTHLSTKSMYDYDTKQVVEVCVDCGKVLVPTKTLCGGKCDYPKCTSETCSSKFQQY